jgi:hypothetical protein
LEDAVARWANRFGKNSPADHMVQPRVAAATDQGVTILGGSFCSVKRLLLRV